MSGAQAKAAMIAGSIGVIAEIDESALMKRHEQGWVKEVSRDLDDCIERIVNARAEKKVTSIGFLGNVVDLWERLANEKDLLVELGSDQTSLHNPYNGGYYPVQLSFKEARRVMVADPPRFKALVQETLRRHVTAINKLTARGMKFWDYGNSFCWKQAGREPTYFTRRKRWKNVSLSVLRPRHHGRHFLFGIWAVSMGLYKWACLGPGIDGQNS